MILDGFPRLYMLSDELTPGFNPSDVDDRTGFRFSLLIPEILIDRTKFDLQKVANALNPALKEWYVEWMGIEE